MKLVLLVADFLFDNRLRFRTKILHRFEDIEVFIEGSFLAAY